MNKIIAVAACLLTLSGCQDSEEQRLLTLADAAKKSIAERYKDPESVIFKDLKLDWQQQHICGELNAKNGYGGYTGFERFRADLDGVGANTVVTNVWTPTEMLMQMKADVAVGRQTISHAEGINKIGFDLMCADVELLKGSKKIPINIPSTS
ncbi:hypothetical protein PS645_04176 [Pseudomonas fluorescens]|uniref:Lipoprotein n=1 Tax=Pseudomonas fluorescens TaxID=294 RepID=A0A5E6VKN6_PSEFL|nr:hypothetical protein [Pseudomonas fluorescens]VVN18497.1 hypothetical protein PS645_04176 [Pseudomonas fluorescens]